MQWTDDAIVLSARKFGENKAVARVFSREHGVYGGVVRGASSKSNRGILQPGNAINVTWNARLSEQLGAFKVELLEPFTAHAMADKFRLAALTSATALLEAALPERHPYPTLYNHFYGFLEQLRDAEHWQETYVKLELEILSQSGFGLDLKTCAATGSADNLTYVSPKSGRAVSRDAGEPYKEKLLELPSFLHPEREAEGSKIPRLARDERKETLAGLRLTGYFLDSRLVAPHGRKLPAARGRLVAMMKEHHG